MVSRLSTAHPSIVFRQQSAHIMMRRYQRPEKGGPSSEGFRGVAQADRLTDTHADTEGPTMRDGRPEGIISHLCLLSTEYTPIVIGAKDKHRSADPFLSPAN